MQILIVLQLLKSFDISRLLYDRLPSLSDQFFFAQVNEHLKALSQHLLQFQIFQKQFHLELPSTLIFKLQLITMQSQQRNGLPQKLLYIFDNDILTVQSSTSFFKANFSTPILQCYQFQQRYQKYFLKSELLSLPIKSVQFDKIYSDIKLDIENEFDYFLKKSMQCIQDLLINTIYYKIEKWHFYAKTTEAFKKLILGKDIDCYNFNLAQFQQKYDRTLSIIEETSIGTTNRNQQTKTLMNKLKMEVKGFQKEIQDAEKNILNKDMFVNNPYKAQNVKNREIDANKLFLSYFNRLKFMKEPIVSGFKLKHDQIRSKVTKFYQGIEEHSELLQKMTRHLLKFYNQGRGSQGDEDDKVSSKVIYPEKKQLISLEEVQPKWSKRQVKNCCLDNKLHCVSHSLSVVVYDEQTRDLSQQILKDPQKKQNPSNFYRLDNIDGTIPMSNEYFDFWDYTYDRQKLRKLHLHKQNIGKTPRNYKEVVLKNMKDLKDSTKATANFESRMYREKSSIVNLCLYSQMIIKRIHYEKKLWVPDQRRDRVEGNRSNYQFKTQIKTRGYYTAERLRQIEVDQVNAVQNLRDEYFIKNSKHEKDYENQTSLKVKSEILSQRNYNSFCNIMQIPLVESMMNETTIRRYNMKLDITPEQNQPLKLEEFLCYYLRERLYRQNETITDKKSIYVFFYSKSIDKFCHKNSIKFLLKKITDQKLKRYVLWGSQIIYYEQFVAPNKQRHAKFTIYPFSELIYSQRIFFQLKRYAPFQISDTIQTKYYRKNESNPHNLIMNKFQIVSRLALKNHLPCPDKEFSEIKGRQLYDKMLQYFKKQIE